MYLDSLLDTLIQEPLAEPLRIDLGCFFAADGFETATVVRGEPTWTVFRFDFNRLICRSCPAASISQPVFPAASYGVFVVCCIAERVASAGAISPLPIPVVFLCDFAMKFERKFAE